jgi:hypothetical protein
LVEDTRRLGLAPSSRDRISVDLHGLKAALLARAKALGVSPSDLVRSALAEAMGTALPAGEGGAQARQSPPSGSRVRLCLHMSRLQASAAIEAARHAGLSPGDYVGSLVANVPVLVSGASRADHIATLVASCAELSTLSRNIHPLTMLLRQADVDPAKPYRAMLDVLAGDVHRHLELAAAVLADLQPQRRATSGAARRHR